MSILLAMDVLTANFMKRSDLADLHLQMRAPAGMFELPERFPGREPGRMGHSYARHPQLTRNGAMIVLGRVSPLLVPAALATANYAVISKAPKAQQRGLWQMFSSGLTGTFGIGSGLKL